MVTGMMGLLNQSLPDGGGCAFMLGMNPWSKILGIQFLRQFQVASVDKFMQEAIAEAKRGI